MKSITVARWIIRILSVAFGAFILFAFLLILGNDLMNHSQFHEVKFKSSDYVFYVSLLCVSVGLFLSWPKEMAGIAIVYVGMMGMFAALNLSPEHPSSPLWPLIFAILPTALLFCRYREKEILKNGKSKEA